MKPEMKTEYTFSPQDFIQVLDNKGIKIKCPLCDHHPHSAITDIENNIYLTIPSATGKYPKQLTEGYLYTIGLVCENCGYLSQFSGDFIRDYLFKAS